MNTSIEIEEFSMYVPNYVLFFFSMLFLGIPRTSWKREDDGEMTMVNSF